jgi:phage-related protein
MPKTNVVLYRENDGSAPLLQWLDGLARKPRAKCIARLQRLAELGHELRRPDADLLRDGIYELRVTLRRQQYRMLYFFHRQVAAVVSHGLLKERGVPSKEIELALMRKREFEANPKAHTYETEDSDG